LLVELADETMGEKDALDALWPVVEEANKHMSSEIRLRREMMIFAVKE
jgi:hypothetical protein